MKRISSKLYWELRKITKEIDEHKKNYTESLEECLANLLIPTYLDQVKNARTGLIIGDDDNKIRRSPEIIKLHKEWSIKGDKLSDKLENFLETVAKRYSICIDTINIRTGEITEYQIADEKEEEDASDN